MPGFDGKGPLGQGPMTGRGQGFCVLKTSRDDPQQVEGFAGINGKPVGKMIEYFRHLGKEVTNMPRGDGTGPAGQGPGTGRSRGQGARPGRGRMGGPFAAGPGGSCICPNCGQRVAHVAGQPCNALSCPKCGARMTRQ